MYNLSIILKPGQDPIQSWHIYSDKLKKKLVAGLCYGKAYLFELIYSRSPCPLSCNDNWNILTDHLFMEKHFYPCGNGLFQEVKPQSGRDYWML